MLCRAVPGSDIHPPHSRVCIANMVDPPLGAVIPWGSVPYVPVRVLFPSGAGFPSVPLFPPFRDNARIRHGCDIYLKV